MKNITTLVIGTIGAVFMSGSAFAGPVGTVQVPEPMSMSLLVCGVVAIAAVKRMHRK